MSIYNDISILFKLAQEINEIKEIEKEEKDDEEKKELAEKFIRYIINIFNTTNTTDDEIFIRDTFIQNNINIISWLKQNNYIDERTISFFDNLQANFKNDKDINEIILENNNINNKNEIIYDDNNYEIINDENDKFLSNKSSLYLIEQNYKKNNKKEEENNIMNPNLQNKFDIKENNINFNNLINNNLNNQINNINIKNQDNNINNENINMQKDDKEELNEEEEEYEEEEEKEEYEEEEENKEEEEEEDEEESDEKNDNNNNNSKDKEKNNNNKINKNSNNGSINEEEEEEKDNDENYYLNNEEKNNISINNINENISKNDNYNNNKINSIIYDDENFEIIENNNEIKNDEEKKDNKNNKNFSSESDSESSLSNSENGEKEHEIDDLLRIPIKDLFYEYHNKNNKENSFNDIFNRLKDLTNNIQSQNKKYKNKLITLVCILFPFFSMDQKKHLYNEIIIEDNNLEVYLKKTLLYYDEENQMYKNFTNILSNIPKKNDKKFKNKNEKNKLILERNLFLNSNEEEKELFFLYQFLIVYKIFGSKNGENIKTFDDKYYLKDFYFIAFKIYFILTHQEYYKYISENFLDIYERLLFMKKFYKQGLVNKVEKPYIISKIKNIKKEDNKLGYIYNGYNLGEYKDINIDDLFDKDELELNEEIIKTIKYFYKIDEDKGINLLQYSNLPEFDNKKYNFVTNLVNLKYTKKILILNDFDKFKSNLINLEKNIKKITNHIFCKEKNDYQKYSINKNIKKIYFSLIKELKDKIKMEKLEFYPVGSMTEFLFFYEDRKKIKSDDLNIYIDIHKLRVGDRKSVLHNIYQYLKEKKYDVKKRKNIILKNLIYDFTYKEIKISLIVLGFGPYIHSLLFRTYSLMDPRFPIVGLTLKHFLRELKLNCENDRYYHNTFLFMNLLVAFLQDIIEPPILPKIFNDKNSTIIPINTPFSDDSMNNKINPFIDELKYQNIYIPKHLNDKETLKNIYNEQIGENKNNLTCAEIFLYFLEFLIYYYKFDTLYINNSLQFEGFDSINNILNDNDDIDDDENCLDTNYPNDSYFKEFLKNYYLKKKNERNLDNNKNALFLIRDPVNPFYNIGDMMDKKNIYDKFYVKIKNGYDILLNTGSFDNLQKIK